MIDATNENMMSAAKMNEYGSSPTPSPISSTNSSSASRVLPMLPKTSAMLFFSSAPSGRSTIASMGKK